MVNYLLLIKIAYDNYFLIILKKKTTVRRVQNVNFLLFHTGNYIVNKAQAQEVSSLSASHKFVLVDPKQPPLALTCTFDMPPDNATFIILKWLLNDGEY